LSEQDKGAGKEVRKKWYNHARPIIGMAIISLLICGMFFPLLITGIAQATMPYQANGELATVRGQVVGSYLIDNNFTQPIFFHARYENTTNSANESASGVDPDITVPEALSQVPRISNWTNIPQANLNQIVKTNEEGTYWIFGSPYVDVLQLNIFLINHYQNLTLYQAYPKS
jgi:potassium-transporting ATPase KdpC subunit